jgi:hypothetical protein
MPAESSRGARAALPPKAHAANEALAFLIELAMLGGLAWWGATVHGGAAVIAIANAGIAAVDRDAIGSGGRARPGD